MRCIRTSRYPRPERVTHLVEQLGDLEFRHVGLDCTDRLRPDSARARSRSELHNLVGDPANARERFGWDATVDLKGLARVLVGADLERLRDEREPASVHGAS
jgi:GDPmannose 4,6-dehydratase